jgi:hypothetical protein
MNAMPIEGGILIADSDWQTGDTRRSQWIFWESDNRKQSTWKAEDSIIQAGTQGNSVYVLCDGKNENGTIYQYQFVEGQLVPVREKTISDKLLPGGADCFFLPY